MNPLKSYYEDDYYKEVPASNWYSAYRAKKAVSTLKSFGEKRKEILNLGCGCGFESQVFSDSGFDVVGVDISKSALACAAKHQKGSMLCDLQQGIGIASGSVGICYCAEVVEHIPFPSYFFKELNRILKKNGTLMLVLPNIACLKNRIHLMLFGDFSERKEEHLHEMTPKEIKEHLKVNGFEIIIFEGAMGGLKKFPSLSREFFIVARKL